jgi:hypothetical protein
LLPTNGQGQLQAREESVQLATELLCTKKQAAASKDELRRALAEIFGLRGKKDASEAAVLKLQAVIVNARCDMVGLQEERDSALASLSTQAAQMQVRFLSAAEYGSLGTAKPACVRNSEKERPGTI